LAAGRPWPENDPKSHKTRRITITKIKRTGTRTLRRRRGGALRTKKDSDDEQEKGREWKS
jgi:hypothetical protein